MKRFVLPVLLAVVIASFTGISAHVTHAQTTCESLIAFTSNRMGNYEIFTMNPDGSNVQQLTITDSDNYFSTWSPDGSRIAFDSNRADGDFNVFVMDADGSNVVQLTTALGEDSFGQWSPDGSQLTFVSNRNGQRDIYIVNADGSGERQLTFTDSDDNHPTWSPNGEFIVFESDRNGDVYQLFGITPDGEDTWQIVDTDFDSYSPTWSEVSPQLIFTGYDGTTANIYTTDYHGYKVNQVTDTAFAISTFADFSPDSTQAIFESDSSGDLEVYRIDIDGTNFMNLTNSLTSDDLDPGWQPCR